MAQDASDVAPAVQVPSTPPAIAPATSEPEDGKADRPSSPAPAGSMTPPPSTQPRRFHSPSAKSNAQPFEALLASPKTMRLNAAKNLPSADQIALADIDELRALVNDLVSALTDARMSAAHFKLQHTLLMMETHEAAQRAEVEHQMAKREIEALQVAEQRHRASASVTPKPQSSPQPQILALSRTCRDLEDERDEMEEQLRQTQKYLEDERDRAETLIDENKLLKKRIRENREHFTRLKDQSPMYMTPRHPFTTPRRKSYSRLPESTPAHDNFAALLYADQMLSQETMTVPSTPTKSQPSRVKQGHVRGAHSLSSLQTTPARRGLNTEPLQGLPATSVPGSRSIDQPAERDRRDRDSTISMSDVEEDGSGEDIGQSQASSLATNMLRRNPQSQESMRQSQDAERSSSLLQTKLQLGNVSKSGLGKRSRKSNGDRHEDKRVKSNEAIGLGVGLEQWSRV